MRNEQEISQKFYSVIGNRISRATSKVFFDMKNDRMLIRYLIQIINHHFFLDAKMMIQNRMLGNELIINKLHEKNINFTQASN